MTWLFQSGHAVDLVLLVVAVEAVWLVRTGRMRAAEAALALLPGAAIMLAVRAALTGAPWPWIAAPLIAALPLHLTDLARRGVFRRLR